MLAFGDSHVLLSVTHTPHTLDNATFLQQWTQSAAGMGGSAPLPHCHIHEIWIILSSGWALSFGFTTHLKITVKTYGRDRT